MAAATKCTWRPKHIGKIFWTFLFRYIFRSTLREYFTFSCPIVNHPARMLSTHFCKAILNVLYILTSMTWILYPFRSTKGPPWKLGWTFFSIEKPQTELKRTISRPVRIFSVWPAPPRVSCGMLLFPLRETARQVGPPLTAWLPACSYLVAWMPTCCWKPVGKLLRLGRWGPNTTLCSALRVILCPGSYIVLIIATEDYFNLIDQNTLKITKKIQQLSLKWESIW